jgi:hypothetical protein
MRLRLPILILLAACSGRDVADDARPAGTAPAAAPALGQTAAAQDADPPDFADPRLFLNLDTLRWAEWETDAPAGRDARLRALGIQPIRADSIIQVDPAEPYDPNGERATDFHFVDFSGDGVADVIYDGPWFMRGENGFGALEGSHVKLYQVIAGRAVEVMDRPGEIQRIWKGRAGEPLSFRTVAYGCCSEPQWTVDYFRPAQGDHVRFQSYRRVMGRSGMEIPTQFMAAPRRFTVANDRYLLRATPQVQDAAGAAGEDEYAWEGHGNAVAEYGRGARGTAIAERTDATGRVWWFVRMDAATPPRAAQTDAPVDEEGHTLPVDRLGWMSSRFVTAEP